MNIFKRAYLALIASLAATAIVAPASAQQPQKPNILVIMADDIGYWNISAYNRGQMGYRTPNIDRIANEGAIFTDYYGQQSCTAGRAAFITGQSPMRTGLLKVGLPGAKEGLSDKDPTIAELLKQQGSATRRLSEESRIQGAIRSARRHEMRRDHDRHARRRSALWNVAQAEMRGHRPAHQEAHGNDR
jgi:hypothetical protein